VQAPTKEEVANERVGQAPIVQEVSHEEATYPRKIHQEEATQRGASIRMDQ
jgi:hypothetical protein